MPKGDYVELRVYLKDGLTTEQKEAIGEQLKDLLYNETDKTAGNPELEGFGEVTDVTYELAEVGDTALLGYDPIGGGGGAGRSDLPAGMRGED